MQETFHIQKVMIFVLKMIIKFPQRSEEKIKLILTKFSCFLCIYTKRVFKIFIDVSITGVSTPIRDIF